MGSVQYWDLLMLISVHCLSEIQIELRIPRAGTPTPAHPSPSSGLSETEWGLTPLGPHPWDLTGADFLDLKVPWPRK